MIKTSSKGFTLVEMLIAVSLFTVITSFAIGAILGIFNANRKLQSSATVVDNLSFAIENLNRTVRFGSAYYCGLNTNLSSVNNCPTGGSSLSVTSYGGRVFYRLRGAAIQRSDNGLTNFVDITDSNVVVQNLTFYVIDTNTVRQPYVIAVIKGYVGNKPTTQTSFSIQTMMSQRELSL